MKKLPAQNQCKCRVWARCVPAVTSSDRFSPQRVFCPTSSFPVGALSKSFNKKEKLVKSLCQAFITCPIILLVRHFGAVLPGEASDLLKNNLWLSHWNFVGRHEHTGGYISSGQHSGHFGRWFNLIRTLIPALDRQQGGEGGGKVAVDPKKLNPSSASLHSEEFTWAAISQTEPEHPTSAKRKQLKIRKRIGCWTKKPYIGCLH